MWDLNLSQGGGRSKHETITCFSTPISTIFDSGEAASTFMGQKLGVEQKSGFFGGKCEAQRVDEGRGMEKVGIWGGAKGW